MAKSTIQVLVSTVLLLLVHRGEQARLLRGDQNVALPDYSVYHTKNALLAKVAEIVKAHSDTMSMTVREGGDQTYNISMQVVDVDLGGVAHKNVNKARILVDFGEHAREFISSELGLSLLQMLADPPSIKALVGGGERGDKLLAQLNNVVFKILPMENERGRDLVEAGRLCERKNGRGVDPNRNWEVDWGKKEKDYDPQEEYPGKAPFSEPESQIVLDLAKTFKPHVWLNVHSGMEAMFTPWDHIGEVADGARDALHILNVIKDSVFTNTCVVGSGGKSVGYLAHGTATDYMFERLHVPMPFTWEIYGDMDASFNDCFRMFNPITKAHVQTVISLWLKAIFRLVELLPTHPAIITDNIFTPVAVSNSPTDPTDSVTHKATRTPDVVLSSGNGHPIPGPEKAPGIEYGGLVVVSTPLHVLRHSSVWTTLTFGLVGVALVGYLVYRFTSKPRSGPYNSPPEA